MGAIKEDLHKLIDTTNDQGLLEEVFNILLSRSAYKEGALCEGLTEEQKREVLASEKELHDDSAWISNEEMKKNSLK